MYRRMVGKKLRDAFAGLNQGRIEPVTEELAPDAEHYLISSHSLSGARRTEGAIRQWYERLLRLLPDIHFYLEPIDVEGPP